jgi:GH15 family glucan-1,4-alpha-glucosidase
VEVRALAARSVEVIREGQAESGGYVASPTFPPYGYSWLRDGAWIADAMSRAGDVESAERFFDWCAQTVLGRRADVEAGGYLDARYTLGGADDVTDWPHRQHDGWGLWLWALRGHVDRHAVDGTRWEDAATLTADYVERVWREPCVDWWEERDGIHAATLGSLAAGLAACSRDSAEEVAEAARAALPERVDGSQLALVPLGVARPDEVAAVGNTLVSHGGGVHRHAEDVYYGGGEWLLLTALRGWERLLAGDEGAARRALDWIAAHATGDGFLPEQSQDHLLHPDAWEFWVGKWGPPPCPLLWSHAMFLTLAHELGEA